MSKYTIARKTLAVKRKKWGSIILFLCKIRDLASLETEKSKEIFQRYNFYAL